MPDKTDEKQGKFQKGKFGNPLGRPKGIRNKVSKLLSKEDVRSRFPFEGGIACEQQEILGIMVGCTTVVRLASLLNEP